jgi:hypothetical protein
MIGLVSECSNLRAVDLGENIFIIEILFFMSKQGISSCSARAINHAAVAEWISQRTPMCTRRECLQRNLLNDLSLI